MIELRELVAAPGLAPVTANVRVGEVVRLDGPAAATRALLEVIAGRRAAVSGEVTWRDPHGRAVLVRAGERTPPGFEESAAVALWRALAGGRDGGRVGHDDDAVAERGGAGAAAAARGFGVAPVIWLIDGVSERAVETVVAAADARVRGGAGALVWTAAAARGHADRAITVAPAVGEGAVISAAATMPPAAAMRARRDDLGRGAAALARFAAAAASSRAALAIAAVGALWLALLAVVIATHEEFWYVEGSRAGLILLARLGGLGVAAITAVAAASRAAVGRAWPAMLRETRVSAVMRALALAVGDAAGAAPAAVVAACAPIWSAFAHDGLTGFARAPLTAIAVVAGAIVAGTVARLARANAAVGAIVGVGVAAALMW